MSTVLVTGATGRLGANLVRALVNDGHDVRSFVMPGDKLEYKLEGLDSRICHGNLTDRESIRKACDGVDQIVHCGAVMEQRPQGMDDVGHFDVNTRGTALLLDAARENQAERFVYMSSTATFDVFNTPLDEMPIRDDSPQRPSSFYGMTKTAAERLVWGYHYQYGLPTVILRPNYIMACEQAAQSWRVGSVIAVLKDLGPNSKYALHVPGVENPAAPVEALGVDPDTPCIPRGPDGKSWQWHVVDVRDVIQAILAAVEKSEAVGESFNIAGPLPMDFEIAARHVAEKLGVEPVDVTIPNQWRFWFDLSRTKKLLGYQPEYDIRRMIHDAFAYLDGKDIGVLPAV